jgi:hypothetical protein
MILMIDWDLFARLQDQVVILESSALDFNITLENDEAQLDAVVVYAGKT